VKLTLLSLGPQLREMRKVAKLSQRNLAEMAGVSREWLSAVENGKVTVEFGKVQDLLSTLGYELKVEKEQEKTSEQEKQNKDKNSNAQTMHP